MTPQRLDSLPDSHTHSSSCWWHPLEARWVCSSRRRDDDVPLVDVRDMLVVHTAMLREFRLSAASVRRVAVGDRRQARRVAEHLRFVGDMLHHHHQGEDDLLWPLLAERAPSQARALACAEAQHTGIDAALTDVVQRRTAWSESADGDEREALADRLESLYGLLRDHLEFEEGELLPVAAAVLSPDEWGAIGAGAAAAMPKPALALAFGMFAYEGDPDVLARMLGAAPPAVRLIMPRLAPRLYARRARRVHGTSRP